MCPESGPESGPEPGPESGPAGRREGGPSPSGSVDRDLVARCLDRIEREGMAALDAMCAEHPDQADRLRRRIDRLRDMGLLDAAAPPPGAALPERLGDFRLLRVLGGGGMGVVYLAVEEALQREVALKVIRPELLYFPGARERFQREVETIARLQHPGVVPIYRVGEEGGIPFFAMERVRGCTLQDVLAVVSDDPDATLRGADFGRAVLARSPDEGGAGAPQVDGTGAPDATRDLSFVFRGTWEEACIRVVRQVAEALEHAHGQGVLHRDIKPSNIMVTPSGRAMILDFGLARREGASRLTRTGSQLGSVYYMAPEQCHGDGEMTARSDVYSLGVVLYELLTRAQPFRGESVAEVMSRTHDGDPTPPRRRSAAVSWELDTVCLAAMEVDPARRYATARDFARDLGNALDHRPIEARRASAARRTRRWAERHPARAVGLVLGGLIALGAPTAYAWMQRDARLQVEAKRQLAEQNLRAAMDAVDRLLARVGEERLRNVPQMEEVRRELLQDAVAFYEAFLARSGDDPDVRFGNARVLLKAADVHRLLGEHERAAGEFDAAYAALSALPPDAAAPEEVAYLRAYALRNQAVLHHLAGRGREVRETLGRAIDLLEPYDAAGQEDVSRELAIIHQNLAIELLGTDLGGAIAHAEDAGRRFEALTERYPGDPRYLARFAQSANALASFLGERAAEGDVERMMESYERAAVVQQRLVSEHPEVAEHRRELASTRMNQGVSLRFTDPGRGVEIVEEAIALQRRLAEDFPRIAQYRFDLARSLNNETVILSDMDRRDEADARVDEALALLRSLVDEAPDVVEYRAELGGLQSNRANTLTGADRLAEAEAAGREAVACFEQLCADHPGSPLYPHLLGASYHGLATAVRKQGRPAEARPLFERAVEAQAAARDVLPTHPTIRMFLRNHHWLLAETCLELGDAEAAIAAARELTALYPDDAEEIARRDDIIARAEALAR